MEQQNIIGSTPTLSKTDNNKRESDKLMEELGSVHHAIAGQGLHGVVWLVPKKAGISYKFLDKKIKVCLRIYALDFACTTLDPEILDLEAHTSVTLNTEHPLVRAEIKVMLKGNCCCWEGDIEYKSHDTMKTLLSKEGTLFCLPEA